MTEVKGWGTRETSVQEGPKEGSRGTIRENGSGGHLEVQRLMSQSPRSESGSEGERLCEEVNLKYCRERKEEGDM